MAIARASTSSIKQGFPKSRSLLAGNTAYDPAGTFLIQRVTATGGESSISFTSIPSTYKHLQLRYIARNSSTASAASSSPLLNFNSDTASNYAQHFMRGDGSTATASGTDSSGGIGGIELASTSLRNTSATGIFGACIVDIHDYTSTNKNKTVRYFGGVDTNTANTTWRVTLGSGLWLSTSAITSLQLFPGVSTWLAGSTFALYGMVG